MKALFTLLAAICWVISIPCTVLVIIFQMAKAHAEWIYKYIDPDEEVVSKG